MVRKQTWILLVVFAALLGAAFYLQKNPLPASKALTPSPTSAPKLLQGWESSNITWMELKEGQSDPIQIVQDAQGNWSLGSGESASVGKAEQLRAEITEMRSIASLPASYELNALGLNAPARTLTIRDKQGKQLVINIGSMDPTESGYYVQVDTQAPAVVDSFTLNGIVDQFNGMLPTPTPELETPSPEETPSPTRSP